MAFPELSTSTAPLSCSTADALVIALPPRERIAQAGTVLDDWPGLAAALEGVGFTGAPGATVRVHLPESTSRPVFVVGTGADPDAGALREAIGQPRGRRPDSPASLWRRRSPTRSAVPGPPRPRAR